MEHLTDICPFLIRRLARDRHRRRVKGGSGKTTVATNLAVIRAAAGRDVLLVDADDQATASDFTMLRNQRLGADAGFTSIMLGGAAVRTETGRLADKYDDIIIDTGGRDTTSQRAALTVSDALLVPFVPRSFDVWTLESVPELIAEIRTVNPEFAAFAFINRADPRGGRQCRGGGRHPGHARADVAADAARDAQGVRQRGRAGLGGDGTASAGCEGDRRDHGAVSTARRRVRSWPLFASLEPRWRRSARSRP